MGVIAKESSRATIISYFGIIIGFISSALIMPKIFSPEQIGVIRVINAASGIFAGIFSLGISQLVFRAYNSFGKEKGVNGFLSITLLVCALGSVVGLPFYFVLYERILDIKPGISEFTSSEYFVLFVYVLIVARIFYIGLEAVLRMTRNISLIAVLRDIVIKGAPLILLILYYFDVLQFDNYVVLYYLIFVLIPIYVFVFLYKREGIKIGKIRGYTKSDVKSLSSLATFGMLNTIAAAFFLFLDTLMVNEFLSETAVGVYSTMFLFGSVVSIPSKSLRNISGVLIVEALQKNAMDTVNEIYKKSTRALIVVCGGVFVLIWANIHSIIGYLDPVYATGTLVVLIIGLAQLFDAVFGTASDILSGSKYYWVHTPITLVMISMAIGTNLWLIPRLEMVGAALATLISLAFLHLTRALFVYFLFKIHPFSVRSTIGMLICLVTFAIAHFAPNFENIYLNLIYKSAIILVVYIPAIYFFKVSEDINEKIDGILKRRN
ncbi:MAG: polysaccharide biosynthesis C-terminal domain-containing protein [Crocinitomicaceae bacterium]|nr:polysaccharide biosynthesis C-terminal domain-containing protein [Crocinitomicaceae bacterium]